MRGHVSMHGGEACVGLRAHAWGAHVREPHTHCILGVHACVRFGHSVRKRFTITALDYMNCWSVKHATT